jgi:hypothetical protein
MQDGFGSHGFESRVDQLIFFIRGEMEGRGGTGILDAAVFDSCF